ncbi:MAG: [FeFe] hydrogenase H-cluster maturation GTPase HydF [Oscillospiraceae bacterium]|nr:[FeFe] hydrogenase H-cluster maturation GTPase HydF [Candidatus Ruminococcus equi]
MSLNETVSAERLHIAFFGKRNAGKSSVVNAVTSQKLSVVSDVLGTTTDPVKKAMELLPLGPVVIIDTPGFDDMGELGILRVEKTQEILKQTDIAVLVVDATAGLSKEDNEFLVDVKKREIPYIIAYNKCDLITERQQTENSVYISAKTNENINTLKEMLAKFASSAKIDKKIVADLLTQGDVAVLVIPIDESAPKGRIILPQQQVLRELLDNNMTAVCTKPQTLKDTLSSLSKKPKIVITDSQAFGEVSKIVPDDIMLTSFSILFARYKGDLETLVKGASKLDKLSDDDTILISEGCTHHRQCNDIGSVKIPNWIESYTKKKFKFEFSSGQSFEKDLSKYALVVHCGGCMLNEKEMKYRIDSAKEQSVDIVNYGVLIAHIHGILYRALEPFPNIQKILK